jgi:hypothetical protein
MTKDGRLESQTVDGRLLVDVSGHAPEPPEPPGVDVALLQARIDSLQAQVDNLTGERDYLRGALAQALRLQTKALEAPGARRWWQFWKE